MTTDTVQPSFAAAHGAALLALLAAGPSPQLQDERLKLFNSIIDNFHGSGIVSMSWIVLAALGVALVMLGLWMRQRRRPGSMNSAPLTTFRQLAAALGMTLSDQLLLARIARQQSLATPLTLLLSGSTLRHHAEGYLATVSSRRRNRLVPRVEAIRRAVFDDEPSEQVDSQETNDSPDPG